jgi:putative ABC transport system permease protein
MASQYLDFDIGLSTQNILTGIWVSVLIGVISGLIPALAASKLDPVEAIRSGM